MFLGKIIVFSNSDENYDLFKELSKKINGATVITREFENFFDVDLCIQILDRDTTISEPPKFKTLFFLNNKSFQSNTETDKIFINKESPTVDNIMNAIYRIVHNY
jgi:hypothetical protein